MGDTSGEFSTKLIFQLIRDRREGFDWARYIWIKGLPSKISFFLWRLRRCIPTDDNVKRLRVQLVSRCYCCEGRAKETLNHLLLIAPIAFSLRKQFATCAGINIEGELLLNIMAKWWNFDCATKWKAIINVVLEIITCEL